MQVWIQRWGFPSLFLSLSLSIHGSPIRLYVQAQGIHDGSACPPSYPVLLVYCSLCWTLCAHGTRRPALLCPQNLPHVCDRVSTESSVFLGEMVCLAADLAALHLLAYPRSSKIGIGVTQPCSRNQPLDQGSMTGSNLAVESAPCALSASAYHIFTSTPASPSPLSLPSSSSSPSGARARWHSTGAHGAASELLGCHLFYFVGPQNDKPHRLYPIPTLSDHSLPGPQSTCC